MKVRLGLAALLLQTSLVFSLPLGQVPQNIDLSGTRGGLVKGDGAWSSQAALQGKVSVVFYVAPAEKDTNSAASAALKEAGFSEEQFQSYAIVNMAASNWPNFIIAQKLKSSQEEFPRTIYVKDAQSVLVKEWQLRDKASDIVAFDRTGKVIFHVDGKLTDDQVHQLLAAVRGAL
jgi:YtfJ family uncharacterized protein